MTKLTRAITPRMMPCLRLLALKRMRKIAAATCMTVRHKIKMTTIHPWLAANYSLPTLQVQVQRRLLNLRWFLLWFPPWLLR